MEKTKDVENTKCWSVWTTIMVILLWLFGLTFWVQYESTQWEEKQKENLEEIKAIILAKSNSLCECCECPKPKAKVSYKKAKPKAKKSKPKPQPSTNKIAIVSETLKSCDSLGGVLVLKDGKVICGIKKEVAPPPPPTERDFYENALMPRTWVTEPEKKVVIVAPPPRVGRKIIVVREQAPYYGGYNFGYSTSYAPQQQYAPPPQQQYIPAPQTVYVPAPQVIVPAPSVVAPARGYAPIGTTGGRSPSGTTGPAL